MLNLKNRIEALASTTSSADVKTACNEALKTFAEFANFNLPANAIEHFENGIAESLISKIESSNESEVVDFVSIEKRILGMRDLGVKKAFESIKKSDIAKHPATMYMLEKMKHVEYTPEWLVIEEAISVLAPYTWDPAVKDAHTVITSNFNKFNEDIKIYRAVSEAKNSHTSFLMPSLEKHIDNYLNHRSSANRTVLLENLSKFNYDTNIRNIYNIVSETASSFQLKEGRSDAHVAKIYSPVIITEQDEIFAVHGKAYVKNENNIRPLVEEEYKKLPAHFTFLSTYLSQPNVEIYENRIKIFSKDKKVELIEETDGLAIYVNEKKVSMQDFHKIYLNSGIFRFYENEVISAVSKIAENWDIIMELDFAKSIFPKGIPSRRADVFRLGNKTHISTVDTVMNEVRFYPDCNNVQSRNMILEFAKFDLGFTFKDLLEREEAVLANLEERKKEFLDAIAFLENKKNQLETVEDAEVRESEEVSDLITSLSEEIVTLKEEYFNVQNEINALTKVDEGLGIAAGDEVEHLKKKEL
jgi:hypothetical protein